MLTKLSATIVIGLILGGLSLAPPALADEFELGIIVGRDVDRSEFMDGFGLAIDESPDVSHPPDSEGGDHLGSMDVATVVQDASALSGTRQIPILVADIPTDTFDIAATDVTPSRTMLILFTDRIPADTPESLRVFTITRSQAEAMASKLSPSFEADFLAAHGEQPSPEATRGYTAGKLVDIAVEATDRDPTDLATLRAALDASVADATSSSTAVQTVTSSMPTPTGSGNRWLIPAGLIAIVAVTLVVVAGSYVRGARRRTSREER